MKKSRTIIIALILAMCLSLIPVIKFEIGMESSSTAYAASKSFKMINFWQNGSYSSKRVAVNGKYFYMRRYEYGKFMDAELKLFCADSKTGKGKLIAKGRLDGTILTDGKTVYYAVENFNDGSIQVYRATAKGKSKKKIKKLHGYNGFGLVALNKDKLYYEIDLPSVVRLNSLSLKTKKTKRITEASLYEYTEYGLMDVNPTTYIKGRNYFYTVYNEAKNKNEFKVYNIKTGKKKTLLRDDEFSFLGDNSKKYIVSKKYLSDDHSLSNDNRCKVYELTTADKGVKKVDEFSAEGVYEWRGNDRTKVAGFLVISVSNHRKGTDGKVDIYDYKISIRKIGSKEEILRHEIKGVEGIWAAAKESKNAKYGLVYFGTNPVGEYYYDPAEQDDDDEMFPKYLEGLYDIEVFGVKLPEMEIEKITTLKSVANPNLLVDKDSLNLWLNTEIDNEDPCFVSYMELERAGDNTKRYYKGINLFDTKESYSYDEMYYGIEG